MNRLADACDASPDPPPDLQAGLHRLGFTDFRPGQREAVETLLSRGRLLLVAPTGGGKSLTFQLPATLLPGTSWVVSPLIALMDDQVAGLHQRGVEATYLSSTLGADDRASRLSGIRDGRYKLVYVAPERFAAEGFRRWWQRLAPPLIAIDEAHCISEWGHDFRPDYLQLNQAIAAHPRAHVLACTATATPVVRDEILVRLGLPQDTPQIVRGFARPNLALRVRDVRGKNERHRAVDQALGEWGMPGRADGVAIVYSPTRARAEEEGARLEAQGWTVGVYHAGLSPDARRRCQERFAQGALEIVVATNAFGMGIDRPDVRLVMHLAPPGSLEAYYQEVGRAGRDGKPAVTQLLVSSQDITLRRRLIRGGAERDVSAASLEHKWSLFLELVRWAEGDGCRHDALLRYFGDEDEALSGCGLCDACCRSDRASEENAEEISVFVRKALSGVARVHGRFGLTAAVKLLRGRRDKRLESAGLTQVRTFGILQHEDERWVEKLLRRCLAEGWIDFTDGDVSTVFVTPTGIEAMKGNLPIRLTLPPRAEPPASPSQPGASRPVAPVRPRRVATLENAGDGTLFAALRQCRSEIARAEGVPPYVVASDHTLRDVAALRPSSLTELQQAFGIGPTRAARYGEALLEVVAGFVAEQGG